MSTFVDMEIPEEKVRSFLADGDIQNRSKRSNDYEEISRSVEEMLLMIKENRHYVLKDGEIESGTEELFHRLQSSLEKLSVVASRELQMQASVFSDCESPQGTPELNSEKKQNFNMSSHHGLDISFDSGGGSSSLSLKDGTEFSSSSSYSESESLNSSINNSYVVSLAESADRGLHKQFLEQETEVPSIKRTFWMGEEDKGSYDELHDRLIRTEEELKVSNLKLQSSEKEVARLKSELEKTEATIYLSEGLQARLESAEKDKQEMETELQVEKRRIVELQKQISQLETRAVNFVSEFEMLMKESEKAREMLKVSDEQIAKLTHELGIMKSDHHKIKELETAFRVSQEQFYAEKAQMQSDILRRVETEKTEMRALHIAQKTTLQGEISQLKEEISITTESLEALNRTHDELKLKYDMLVAAKDEVIATVHTLVADKESREIHVHELEGHLKQLQEEKMGVIAGAESLQKQSDDLKLRLSKLQEEVKMQRVLIEDGAEGKREAIRQLCFSLEYYRSGYQELRQAFTGHKRRTMLTV